MSCADVKIKMTSWEKAKILSEDFLANEKEYMLGFVEAEKSNPLTRNLGEEYVHDTKKGVEILNNADIALISPFEKVLKSDEFNTFAETVTKTVLNGGRVFISGCGSPGRLAMRLEASWREATQGTKYLDSVLSIMTGGDFALIRAVESFEDYIQLGQLQARDLNINEKDLLIGVTATGETTSILGTAIQALYNGARVYMVICTDPKTIIGKLKRADMVYTHKNCKSIYIECGPMAVTGSTRMQSSTAEQAVVGSALEIALARIFDKKIDTEYLIKGFTSAINAVKMSSESVAINTETEQSIYEKGGHLTYFASEYLLDVLSDTTERSPTFSTPPFRPQKNTDQQLSLAFVKNPFLSTEQAWEECFFRKPRCFVKNYQQYKEIGVKDEDIKKIPKIDIEALYAFEIGNEPDPERESGDSLAVWVGDSEAPREFNEQAAKYKESLQLILNKKDVLPTCMKLFDHLAMKLLINTVSTGTMAKMGKIRGNYMINLKISNKKLIDRATRIISDLCGISYEEANVQLFYSKLLLDENNSNASPAGFTIERLKDKKGDLL
jgi:N-acetylmuramic acid 6-phosphate etherase